MDIFDGNRRPAELDDAFGSGGFYRTSRIFRRSGFYIGIGGCRICGKNDAVAEPLRSIFNHVPHFSVADDRNIHTHSNIINY